MVDLKAFKDDYDWQHAFYEAEFHCCKPHGPVPESVLNSVVRVVACAEGENDGPEWLAVVELQDGRFAVMAAGCDYTGWDCQASGTLEFYPSEGMALTDLTPEQAARLGVSHDHKANV